MLALCTGRGKEAAHHSGVRLRDLCFKKEKEIHEYKDRFKEKKGSSTKRDLKRREAIEKIE